MAFFEFQSIQFSVNTWSVPDYSVDALLLCCFSDFTAYSMHVSIRNDGKLSAEMGPF